MERSQIKSRERCSQNQQFGGCPRLRVHDDLRCFLLLLPSVQDSECRARKPDASFAKKARTGSVAAVTINQSAAAEYRQRHT